MEEKMKFSDVFKSAPENFTIQDAIGKCYQLLQGYDSAFASISGGWDSDIMLHIIILCGGKDKATFAFFNTGLEYEATKRHIKFLQEKYGIEIVVVPPIKPIPVCVKEYGVPFWSKQASEYISRLQSHGFMWEDEPFEVLLKKYPRCKASLRWWCNEWPTKENGQNSRFNISYTPWLKEFMIENPPDFKISAKCCTYAKKEPAKKFLKDGNFELNCTGERKAEGGARATAYKSCYTQELAGPSRYRPLFWFTDADKVQFDEHYGLEHSDCYKVWGMKRTGCAGCPFGKNFETEIALAEKYEPKFHRAMLKVFGASYDYTRRFLAFREEMKNKEKGRLNECQSAK